MNHLSLGMNQVLWSTCLVYLECMITFLKFPYAMFKILSYLLFGYTRQWKKESQLFSKKNIYFFQKKSLESNFYSLIDLNPAFQNSPIEMTQMFTHFWGEFNQ